MSRKTVASLGVGATPKREVILPFSPRYRGRLVVAAYTCHEDESPHQ